MITNEPRQRYRTVTDLDEIKGLLRGKPTVAFDFETSPTDAWRREEWAALDAHKSVIAGCSFATDEDTVFYVPLNHRVGKNAERQDELWQFLKDEIFESSSVMKIAHNLAFEAMFLYAKGIVVQMPCYDTIAASQLTLKSYYEFRDLHDSGLKTLVPSLFGVTLPTFEEVTQGRFFDELDPADWDTCRYACADSDWTLKLYNKFNTWFDKNIPAHRFIVEQIESPTAVFTGMMKYNGVLVDQTLMAQRREVAEEKLQELRERIEQFTGDIDIGENCGTNAFKTYLFDTCGLPVLKTTMKNAEAADDETIQLLTEYCRSERPELIEMFELVQEYRKWAKIKSTYIDGYSKWINSATGRIHPDLMPMGTDTGRFAARKPNLQNMPRKGSDPIGVRHFVIAPEGSSFLDFDFSQIELRVLAHISGDQNMIKAFNDNTDIHTVTASEVFDMPPQLVTPIMRSRAKAVNFGIVYGIGAFSLAKDIGVSRSEADEYIKGYLRHYSGVDKYMHDVVEKAKKDGYAETMFARRRYLPELTASNANTRAFGERVARNMPIQGTAADIIKIAMIRVYERLERENLAAKLIMQVHDELIVEAPENEKERVSALLKEEMENAVKLSVALTADVHSGRTWYDAKG